VAPLSGVQFLACSHALAVVGVIEGCGVPGDGAEGEASSSGGTGQTGYFGEEGSDRAAAGRLV
jgi:hypothetical protein